MEEPAAPSREAPRFCTTCGAPVEAESACVACAAKGNAVHQVAARADVSGVKSALLLYFAFLAALVLGSIAQAVVGDELGGAGKVELAVSAGTSLLVLVWAIFRRRDVLPALRTRGPWWAYVAAACIAPLTYTLASLAVKSLGIWLGVESLNSFSSLAELGLGALPIVLVVAVQPAVFEELAFRGIVQPGLASAMSKRDAVLAASAMFAILHLSIPSFVHLMVLGVAVGCLRVVSGSLYPSMLLHFLHNLTVLATDGLFNDGTG